MDVTGVVVIGALDVLLPAGVAAWLTVLNVQRHRTARTEAMFWFFTALALVLPGLAGVNGILGIPLYEGGQVIPTTMVSLPGSIVAMTATIPLTGVFFDDASWASTGYFAVMPMYLVGAVLWQLVTILGIRRLSQHARAPRLRPPPPIPV